MNLLSNKSNILFINACLFFSLTFFLGAIGNEFSISYMNLISAFILFIIYSLSNRRVVATKQFQIWTYISILLIFFSFLFVGGGVGSLIYNVSFVLLICIFYNISLSKYDIKLYVTYIRILNFYLLLYVLFTGKYDGFFGGINSNSIGIQAAINFALFSIFPYRNKIIQLLLLGSSVFIALLASSRTSLGSILLFVIMGWISKYIFQIYRCKNVCYWILILLAIYVTYLYSYTLSEYAFIYNAMEYSTENFNKSIFTGREYIWQMAWDKLLMSTQNLLFGIGSNFYAKGELSNGSNFHSSFFTIVICCGFCGYFCLMKLFHFLFKGNPKNVNNSGRFSLLSLPLMFIGIFESVLFGGNFAIQLCMFIAICHTKNDSEILFFASK